MFSSSTMTINKFSVYRKSHITHVFVLLILSLQSQCYVEAQNGTEGQDGKNITDGGSTDNSNATRPNNSGTSSRFSDQYNFNIFGLGALKVYAIYGAIGVSLIVLSLASIYYVQQYKRLPLAPRKSGTPDLRQFEPKIHKAGPLDNKNTIMDRFMKQSNENLDNKSYTENTIDSIVDDGPRSKMANDQYGWPPPRHSDENLDNKAFTRDTFINIDESSSKIGSDVDAIQSVSEYEWSPPPPPPPEKKPSPVININIKSKAKSAKKGTKPEPPAKKGKNLDKLHQFEPKIDQEPLKQSNALDRGTLINIIADEPSSTVASDKNELDFVAQQRVSPPKKPHESFDNKSDTGNTLISSIADGSSVVSDMDEIESVSQLGVSPLPPPLSAPIPSPIINIPAKSASAPKPEPPAKKPPPKQHESLLSKFMSTKFRSKLDKGKDGAATSDMEEDINKPTMGKKGFLDSLMIDMCACFDAHGQGVYMEPRAWTKKGEVSGDNYNPMAELVSHEQESYMELSTPEPSTDFSSELSSAAATESAAEEKSDESQEKKGFDKTKLMVVLNMAGAGKKGAKEEDSDEKSVVSEYSTAVDTSTVLDDTSTVLDDTSTVLDGTSTVLNDTSTVLEDTSTVLEDTSTVLEESSTSTTKPNEHV